MKKLEKFYEELYFIAFKSLMLDFETWTELDEKYAVKAQILEKTTTGYPEVSIMVVNRNGKNVYEHKIIVSKATAVNGTYDLKTILKTATPYQRARYVLRMDEVATAARFRMPFVPVHYTNVSDDLENVVHSAYYQSISVVQNTVYGIDNVDFEKQQSLKK